MMNDQEIIELIHHCECNQSNYSCKKCPMLRKVFSRKDNQYMELCAARQAAILIKDLYKRCEYSEIRGYWIDENPEDLLDIRMRCSNCHMIQAPYTYWNFCPNCGARMEIQYEH